MRKTAIDLPTRLIHALALVPLLAWVPIGAATAQVSLDQQLDTIEEQCALPKTYEAALTMLAKIQTDPSFALVRARALKVRDECVEMIRKTMTEALQQRRNCSWAARYFDLLNESALLTPTERTTYGLELARCLAGQGPPEQAERYFHIAIANEPRAGRNEYGRQIRLWRAQRARSRVLGFFFIGAPLNPSRENAFSGVEIAATASTWRFQRYLDLRVEGRGAVFEVRRNNGGGRTNLPAGLVGGAGCLEIYGGHYVAAGFAGACVGSDLGVVDQAVFFTLTLEGYAGVLWGRRFATRIGYVYRPLAAPGDSIARLTAGALNHHLRIGLEIAF